MEQLLGIFAEVALKEGQKAAANFGLRLATVGIASVAAIAIENAMNADLKPIDQYGPDEQDKQKLNRALRDTCVTVGCQTVGHVLYKLSEATIESSNLI